jgi:hypothetical protein
MCHLLAVVEQAHIDPKNLQVKKVQSDQYARVPKQSRMLSLLPCNSPSGIVTSSNRNKEGYPKKGRNSSLKTCATASLLVRSLIELISLMQKCVH